MMKVPSDLIERVAQHRQVTQEEFAERVVRPSYPCLYDLSAMVAEQLRPDGGELVLYLPQDARDQCLDGMAVNAVRQCLNGLFRVFFTLADPQTLVAHRNGPTQETQGAFEKKIGALSGLTLDRAAERAKIELPIAHTFLYRLVQRGKWERPGFLRSDLPVEDTGLRQELVRYLGIYPYRRALELALRVQLAFMHPGRVAIQQDDQFDNGWFSTFCSPTAQVLNFNVRQTA